MIRSSCHIIVIFDIKFFPCMSLTLKLSAFLRVNSLSSRLSCQFWISRLAFLNHNDVFAVGMPWQDVFSPIHMLPEAVFLWCSELVLIHLDHLSEI